MADYRQDCPTPGCSYTGFSGHSPGCPVPFQQAQYERERKQKRDAEDQRWNDFFSKMTDEEVCLYIEAADKEISKLQRFVERRNRGLAYFRKKNKHFTYMDWKRKRSK